METHGDSEGNKRLPLYDFRYFPDFLGSVSPSVVLSPSQSMQVYCSLGSPPRWPPKYSGTIRGSRRAFHRFFGLSWENSILDIRVLFTWLLVYMATCFFSDDVLQRDRFIERVELFEPSSIHGTISRESTFHLYFVKVESGFSRNDRNLSRQKNGGRKPP